MNPDAETRPEGAPLTERGEAVEVPDACTCQPATLGIGPGGKRLVLHQIMCASLGLPSELTAPGAA